MAMAVGEGGEQGATGGRLPRRPPGGAAPAQQRLLRQQAPLLSALLPGHAAQATYRVSDTRRTRIRRGYGADMCPRSIGIKINGK